MKKVKWRLDYGRYVPFCPYCDEPAYEKDRCAFCGKKYKWVEWRPKVKFQWLFAWHWFTFPLCVEWHGELLEYMTPANRLSLHFLWWHFAWTFWKGGAE